MTIYKLMLGISVPNQPLSQPIAVLKDGSSIVPFDPENTDYQAYLKWLAEGNQPLPADEGIPPA